MHNGTHHWSRRPDFRGSTVVLDYKEVICFIESLKMKLGFDNKYSIECGYEAGCLGYTLYH